MKKINDSIPSTYFILHVHESKDVVVPEKVTTDDLFKNKTIVVFSIPGAFTPMCSKQHLPGYERLYNKFISLGIDDVYCISVNDPYVLYAWGVNQRLPRNTTKGAIGFKNVKLISDGNVSFTRGMGLSRFEYSKGFGERSKRYSMLVQNKIIKKIFVESNDDLLEKTDAQSMLDFIDDHFT